MTLATQDSESCTACPLFKFSSLHTRVLSIRRCGQCVVAIPNSSLLTVRRVSITTTESQAGFDGRQAESPGEFAAWRGGLHRRGGWRRDCTGNRRSAVPRPVVGKVSGPATRKAQWPPVYFFNFFRRKTQSKYAWLLQCSLPGCHWHAAAAISKRTECQRLFSPRRSHCTSTQSTSCRGAPWLCIPFPRRLWLSLPISTCKSSTVTCT